MATTSTATQQVTLKPITGTIGAEVEGIDLTKPLNTEAVKTLHDGLCEHLVLFFRDQNITPEQHRELAAHFGPLQTHPAYPTVEGYPMLTILENDADRPSKIEKWHTDMTFMPRPPLGAILQAQAVPPQGGDTLFANMEAAYEALSDKMQRFLSELTAIHDFAFGFKESLAEPGGRERLGQALIDNPPVAHPVIRTHPVTGRKALFVNCLFTRQIKELKPRESEALLEFLYRHAVQDEFCCRFRWRQYSIAFWDNRATQHKPVNDYYPAYRRMQRITIEGDRPV